MFWSYTFPVYRQLDQMDCGPTCLKIIAEYFGKNFSLEYLRQISSLQKGGVSLAGLSSALENIGFTSFGIRASAEELINEVPLPTIAHWEGNHFLVVYKTDRKHIFVSDPAIGAIKYSHKEFLQRWCDPENQEGILLLIEPLQTSEIFVAEEYSKGSIRYLLFYIKPYSRYVQQVFLGLFIASIVQLLLPFLTQSLVDHGINYENFNFIHLVVIAQLLLFGTYTATEILRDQILLHLSTRINIHLISDFLDKLLQLPLRYFDSKTTGDFMQRINDHSRIDEFLAGRFLTILFDLFSIIAFGLVLSLFNTTVFIVFLLGTICFGSWSLLFMKEKEKLDHNLFNVQRQEQSVFLDLFEKVQEIKINNSESRRKEEWKKLQFDLFEVRSKFLRVDQYQINGGRLIKELMQIIIIFWSARAVVFGEMTLGTMLAIQFIVGSLSVPIGNSIDFLVEFQKAKLSFKRLAEVHENDLEGNPIIQEDIIVSGNIEIRDIQFGYGGLTNRLIINNLSISIPHGKVTAIVGLSGAGKTTFLKLLLKLYKYQSGNIMIGGREFSDLAPDSWRRICGAVLQDGALFNDTIERNITESKSDLPLNIYQFEKALRTANLHHFVASLPLGSKTKIGEQGLQLSGGEKQRLLIARAVYKDPQYLFFDEATSSLDAENEKVITENLTSLFNNKTVLVIAHRLSTVKNADQILVMDKGEIVEQGTHLELINREGLYHKLIKNQL